MDSIQFVSKNDPTAVSPAGQTSLCSSDSCSSPGDEAASSGISKPIDLQCSDANSSISSVQLSAKRSKKKGKSIFSFFSVKEPSQQAFEEYQRYLSRKGKLSDGRNAAVGIPGVSSAKMPSSVPKVNSKWDGVPQVLKEKAKAKEEGTSSIGTYSRSISTATSDESSRTFSSSSSRGDRPRYKLPSKSDTNLADLYGWESASMVDPCSNKSEARNPLRNRGLTSRTRSLTMSSNGSSLPFQTPPLPPLPTHLSDDYLSVQLPPMPSKLLDDLAKEKEHDVGQSLEPPPHCFSPALTPPELSPITPNRLYPIMRPRVSAHTKCPDEQQGQLEDDAIKTTTIDIPSLNEIVLNPNNIPVLGPPVTARRKKKHRPFLADEDTELIL